MSNGEENIRVFKDITVNKQVLVILLSILLILAGTAGLIVKQQRRAAKPVTAQVVTEPAAGLAADFETTARGTDKLAAKPSIWPVAGVVTSGFGWRNSPWGAGQELHPGIDIANGMETPIVATADGVVISSGVAGGYGNTVQVDHGNSVTTLYGHNSQLAVTAGQQVRKGQVIAYMGSTGISTGPHVHYEVRVNDTPVDPLSFLVAY